MSTPSPCVTVNCRTCNAPSDDDEIGVCIHFPNVDEARDWVTSAGWDVDGLDATCPGCKPAEVAPDPQPWPDLFEALP